MSEYQTIRVELLEDERVLDITLAGGKGNILSLAMMSDIRRALDAHRDRAGLKMVLLRGDGKHFSFGASVEEHLPEQAAGMLEGFRGLCRDVGHYPVPTAALVEGRCLGGAFELVLCCHLVFAGPKAIFACPEIKLGVFPPVLAAVGAHRLGGAAMERLVITGGDLPAADAHRLGWLAGLLEGEEPALEQLLAWYRQNLGPLSAYSLRQALAAARDAGGLAAALGEPLEVAERRYLEGLLPSRDGNEGIRAFVEKRKPAWQDK